MIKEISIKMTIRHLSFMILEKLKYSFSPALTSTRENGHSPALPWAGDRSWCGFWKTI